MELTVRLPEEVHARMTEEAQRRGISLNALITIVLTEWDGSLGRMRAAIEEAKGADDGS